MTEDEKVTVARVTSSLVLGFVFPLGQRRRSELFWAPSDDLTSLRFAALCFDDGDDVAGLRYFERWHPVWPEMDDGSC